MMDLLANLRSIIGDNNVLTAAEDVGPFTADVMGLHSGKALCVVRPASSGEVGEIVRACVEAGVPLVPQGGNTGLCGGAIPDGSGRAVVVSLSRLNKIRRIDARNNSIAVDAGCVLADIQAQAAAVDRLFPMSLGSEGSCQVGGIISTNAGGTNVLRYGTMRDLVLGLEVVLPSGQMLDAMRGLRKDNTGYDLKQLFIGAEGTLGIITGAVLKLFAKPACSVTALAALPSVTASLELLAHLRARCGDRLTNFEIISAAMILRAEALLPDLRNPLREPAPWYQLIELTDVGEQQDIQALLENALESALEGGLISDAAVAASHAQAEHIWRIRHSMLDVIKTTGRGISFDTSVPLSAIPDFVERGGHLLNASHPEASALFVGHIGDGNIHFNASFPLTYFKSQEHYAEVASTLRNKVYDLVTMLGGSISAEHGIGQKVIHELPRYKSTVEMEIMRQIKAALDPKWLLNPGKLLKEQE